MQTVSPDDAQKKELAGILARCPLFRALKEDHFPQILGAGELLRFEPGEAIIRQGSQADSFFVILEGEAVISLDKGNGESVQLGRVPYPNSVGEVGLLLNEERSASVAAATEVLTLRFGRKAFDAMFEKIKNFGMGVSQGLAYRLSHVSGRLGLPPWDESQGAPAAEVVTMLPTEFCRRHRVLPLAKQGSTLTLGCVDEPTSAALQSVRDQLPGLDLRPVSVGRAFFEETMRTHAGVKGWTTGSMPAVTPEDEKKGARSPRLDAMLERMVAEGASDLHLSAGHKPRWRVDGEMHEMADASVLGPEEVWTLLEPVVEKRHRDQFLGENDTDLGYTLPGVARFRVNVFRNNKGVSSVLRQIPSKIMTLEELGLPDALRRFCEIPKGLVLVTGPTGSGKSTTLAAMIDSIKRTRRCHILTLEDPIEFLQESDKALVNQREIGGHTQSFARGLRAALREDPDVVLVGEMRDQETVQLALETANTGHLVFATLHTNTATSAIDRIIEQFPADEQAQIRSSLADVLRGVVAQTLVRKPEGGRMAVLEILVVTPAVANLVREHKSQQLPGVMQTSRGIGMALLNDELQRLVESKTLPMETALATAVDKEDFKRRFRSGVTVAATPNDPTRFRVMAVVKDSPGDRAGLRRGDMIIEVNKQEADQFTLEDLRSLFRTDGKHALVLDRSGKREKLLLELSR